MERPITLPRTCILQPVVFLWRYVCFVSSPLSASFFVSVSSFFLVSLEMSLFPSIFVPSSLSLCMESTPYVSPLPDGVFLPCDHGLDFLHQPMR